MLALLFTLTAHAHTADPVCGPYVNPAPQVRFVRSILRGNVLFPQAGQGIEFLLWTELLTDLNLLPELFEPITEAEVVAAARVMDRMHTAINVQKKFTADELSPIAGAIKPSRLRHLLHTAQTQALLKLVYLAGRREPLNPQWRAFRGQLFEQRGALLPALTEFFARENSEDPDSVMGNYLRVLRAVVSGAELKTFSRAYRADVRAWLAQGRYGQPKQAKLEFMAATFLRAQFERYADELLAPDRAECVKGLFFWDVGFD